MNEPRFEPRPIAGWEAETHYRDVHAWLGTIRDECVTKCHTVRQRSAACPSEAAAALLADLTHVIGQLDILAAVFEAGAKGVRIVGVGEDGLRVRPLAGVEDWRERPSEIVRTQDGGPAAPRPASGAGQRRHRHVQA